jgi:hypothetical protein
VRGFCRILLRKPGTVRDLNYQLKQPCYRNRGSSYATLAKRIYHLMLIENQSYALGIRGMNSAAKRPNIHCKM